MLGSVKRAIDILQFLSNAPEEPVTLTRLSEHMGLNKSTCSHILETLCETQLVERVSRKDGYRLGVGTYMLTRYGRYQESLVNTAAPVIRSLSLKIDATVFLTVICDGTKYIIFNIDNNRMLDPKYSRIIKGNVNTATGQLMMAYMDRDMLNRAFIRQNSHSPSDSASDRKPFEVAELARLKEIRQRGYAHVSEEKNQSFAFRVHNGDRTVAAVGVLYPTGKDSPSFQTDVIKFGQIAAREISRRLVSNHQM